MNNLINKKNLMILAGVLVLGGIVYYITKPPKEVIEGDGFRIIVK